MLAFATPALGWKNLGYDPGEGELVTDPQLRDALPIVATDHTLTCGGCAHYRGGTENLGQCRLRTFRVAADDPACEWYDAASGPA